MDHYFDNHPCIGRYVFFGFGLVEVCEIPCDVDQRDAAP